MLVFLFLSLLMIGVALTIVLPAFWGRYQKDSASVPELNIQIAREKLAELQQLQNQKVITEEEYHQQRNELEQNLALELDGNTQIVSASLGDKRIFHVSAVVLLVPVVAFLFYFSVGNPGVFFQPGDDFPQRVHSEMPATHQSMEQVIAGLEQRLRNNPNDPDGWMMLGRSYMSLKRYGDAVQVFEKVISMMGEQAPVLVAMADAMIMARGGIVSGEPADLVKKALREDPDNVTGLWLAGLAEEEQGNNQQAVQYWRKAETLLVNDPVSINELHELIGRAESNIKVSKVMQDGKKITETVATGINVNVVLDKEFTDSASPDDTVFIYAQAQQGMKMPLAIIKKKVSELPVNVILDDQTAVMPGMELSKFPRVNLVARISKSGQAKAQSGDFIGSVQNIATKSDHVVTININQQVP